MVRVQPVDEQMGDDLINVDVVGDRVTEFSENLFRYNARCNAHRLAVSLAFRVGLIATRYERTCVCRRFHLALP